MSRLQLAVEQISFARDYTIWLPDQTPATEWFRLPPGGVSHIAWQVGHLAFAEYSLALCDIRGPQPQDNELISEKHLTLFGPESCRTLITRSTPASPNSGLCLIECMSRFFENWQTWAKANSISPSRIPCRLLGPSC